MKQLIRGVMVMAMSLLTLSTAACGDDIVVGTPGEGVISVAVSPANPPQIAVGGTFQLAANVNATAGISTAVDWTSSDNSKVTVSETGLVTGIALGNSTVRATSRANPARSASVEIIVSNLPTGGVQSIAITPASASIMVGQTVTPVATVARNPGVSGAVTWASNTESVAMVSTSGVITGQSVGTAVVIARAVADTTQMATMVVTVTERESAIAAFTVTPNVLAVRPGQTVQMVSNVTTRNNVTSTTSWITTNTNVAIVDASGRVTGVTDGTAVIRVIARAASDSMIIDVPVTVRTPTPAQIGISSITQGSLQTPISLNNVSGQIEVNMVVSPGEQAVDSIAVFIGARRAAKQSFTGSLPTQSTISLSVNTADYIKESTGLTTVYYPNGPTNLSAVLYPTTGASIATNAAAVVLNNADAFAASMTAPTRTANAAGGAQWHGGPGANGRTTITLYPVFYSGNRMVGYIDARFGTGPVERLTTAPFRMTIGNESTDTMVSNDYAGYVSAGLENVVVVGGQDQIGGALPTALISNNVIFGSTPTPIRLDYEGPTVTTPSVVRTAPAVTGWVNASFSFLNFTSVDAGVGLKATRDRSVAYSAPDCGGATAQAMATGTGADIPECTTNPSGGSSPTGPYTVAAIERDRLDNAGTSAASVRFGVDKTAPQIRRSALAVVDSGSYGAVPATTFRVDYLDNRAGFYNASQPLGGTAAQQHALTQANALNATGTCVVGTGTPGAAFISAPTCGQIPITTAAGGITVDGWQDGASISIPAAEGYYTYQTSVIDAAGNSSAAITIRALLDATAPVLGAATIPAAITGAALPTFTSAFTDNVEIQGSSLQLTYPNIGDVQYPFLATAARFDDVITASGNTTRGLPYSAPFVRRIERVTAAAFPASNIAASGVPANVKPTGAQILGFDQRFNGGISVFSAIVGANVENGDDFADINAANPTGAVDHFRIVNLGPVANSAAGLKAEAVSPTGTSGAPFVRVDFYRENGGVYEYLGSTTAYDAADNGVYRSLIYRLTSYANRPGSTSAQSAAIAGETVVAVGVTSQGDGLATLDTVTFP